MPQREPEAGENRSKVLAHLISTQRGSEWSSYVMFAVPKVDLSLVKAPTYHEGWMMKQGGLLKGWNPRYFVLCGGELSWFTEDVSDGRTSTKTSKTAERCKRGAISLEGGRVVKSTPTPPGAYGWVIVAKDGAAFHLRCDSLRGREGWLAKMSRIRNVEVRNTAPQRKGSLLGRLLRGGHSAGGLGGDLGGGDRNSEADDSGALVSPPRAPRLHSVTTRRGSLEVVFASPGADEEICNKFTCPDCFQGFAEQELLKDHFKAAHGPKITFATPGADEEILNGFTCPECYQKFPSQETLLGHFSRHGPRSGDSSRFSLVERSIFDDAARLGSFDVTYASEFKFPNNGLSENSSSSSSFGSIPFPKLSDPSTSSSSSKNHVPRLSAQLGCTETTDSPRPESPLLCLDESLSRLSFASSTALHSLYERPSDAFKERDNLTAPLPPLKAPQGPALTAAQADALAAAVAAAAAEADAWVAQVVAAAHADFATPGGSHDATSASGASEAVESGHAADATEKGANYSRAAARRRAVSLHRVGSEALTRELTCFSWGGVAWLHHAEERRAELELEARSLAPGAVRLAGCFSDARVRLAHALAQLAADEVAALGAALDKEVRPSLPQPSLEALADALADCKARSLARLANGARRREQQARLILADDEEDEDEDKDALSPTARAHLDLPAPATKARVALPTAASLFEVPANDVLSALWATNDELLERAGEVQAQCVEAFVSASSAVKEASRSRPTPRAEVEAGCAAAAAALEASVRDGLWRLLRGSDGGRTTRGGTGGQAPLGGRYAEEQALEARALAATDPLEVLSAWPAHCAAHLDDALAASLDACRSRSLRAAAVDAAHARQAPAAAPSSEALAAGAEGGDATAPAADAVAGLERCADALGLAGAARAAALGPRRAQLDVQLEAKGV